MEWKNSTVSSCGKKQKIKSGKMIEKIYPHEFISAYADKPFKVYIELRRWETPKGVKVLLNEYSLGLMDLDGNKISEGFHCSKDVLIEMIKEKSVTFNGIEEFANSIEKELDYYAAQEIKTF